MFTEHNQMLPLLSPTADGFSGTVNVRSVNMANYDNVSFIVSHRGGTTGRSTLTILSSTDAARTGAEAIPYTYRRKTTGVSAVWGAILAATAAGVDTIGGEETLIEIFIKADDLVDGKPYANLRAVEAADDPVTAAVYAILTGPRFAGLTQPSAFV